MALGHYKMAGLASTACPAAHARRQNSMRPAGVLRPCRGTEIGQKLVLITTLQDGELTTGGASCSRRRLCRPRMWAPLRAVPQEGGYGLGSQQQQQQQQQQAVMEQWDSSMDGERGRSSGDGGSGGAPGGQHQQQQQQQHPRLPEGRFSYKMVKAQPLEVIMSELRRRRVATWGRKDQLASRLYTALCAEGRALTKEESVAADAAAGLTDIAAAGASGSDSDWEEGGAVAAGELASSADLAANPLLKLQSSQSGRFLTEINQERLMSNAGSLQLYFLWGATAPNGIKLTTSCLARTAKSVWLFECGEDAQRQLTRNESIAWAKLERIFISSLAADNICGLPGMLCTISAAREKGHEAADTPLHVYGPAGLADYINTMLTVSRTYLEMPVIIHEFSTQAIPDEQLDELVQINPRARLYVTRLPPDQLNPEGYYNGEMQPLLSRHTRKRSNSGIDLRAGTLPLVLPSPGDPRRTGLSVADLTWTLKMDHEWLVRVAPLRNKQPTFGYLMQEAERMGKLYVERAVELGVEIGEDFTRLKSGESVETPEGNIVHPWQCVGPMRRGRRVAIIGSCLDASTFAKAMADIGSSRSDDTGSISGGGGGSLPPPAVDVVVHCMSMPPGAAPDAPRTAAASVAGAAAAVLRGKELVLWQRQSRFAEGADGQDETYPAEVLEAARAALGSNLVSLGGCYWCYQPDREPEATDFVPPPLPQ